LEIGHPFGGRMMIVSPLGLLKQLQIKLNNQKKQNFDYPTSTDSILASRHNILDKVCVVVAHFVTSHLALGSSFRLNCQHMFGQPASENSLICHFLINFSLHEVYTISLSLLL
jgi:hypothetical protein